ALEREKETTYLQRIALAGRELAAGNVGRAEELLAECPEHLRGWEWHFLKRQRYGNAPPLQHKATVVRVAVSRDGKQIASVSMDGTFEIRNARTGDVLYTLEPQMVKDRAALVRGMAYSPDSNYLAVARHDGGVRVFDARGPKEPLPKKPLHVFEGHKGAVWHVAFSPDSRTLASGGADKTVRLWDMTNGLAVGESPEHPAGVRGVAFRPDGQAVLASCDDGTLKVWDRNMEREVFSFRGKEPKYGFVASFS